MAVVLLDVADVFLEQRSLHNLERNALVSGMYMAHAETCPVCDRLRKSIVFLRVLEYYDGEILIQYGSSCLATRLVAKHCILRNSHPHQQSGWHI